MRGILNRNIPTIYFFSKVIFFAVLFLLGLQNQEGLYAYYRIVLLIIVLFYISIKLIDYSKLKLVINKNSIVPFVFSLFFIIYFSIASITLGSHQQKTMYLLKMFFGQTFPGFLLGILMFWKQDLNYFIDRINIINYLFTLILIMASVLSNSQSGFLYNFSGATHLLIGYTVGALMIYNVFVIMELVKKNKKNCFYRCIISIVLFISQSYLLIASGSRGAAVSVVAVLLFIALRKLGFLQTLTASIFVMLILFVIINFILSPTSLGVDRFLSLYDFSEGEINIKAGGNRIKLYLESWQLFLKNPIFGAGPGEFEYFTSLPESYSHNIQLEILSEYGLVGFSLFFIILIKTVELSWKILIIDKKERLIVYLLLFQFIGLQFSGSFIVSYQFWFLMGGIFAVPKNYFKVENRRG